MDYSRTARMIFSKFYYYTSIAATQYILGIRYIACRLQRWAWSKANNLIFRCFQWEPIIIVVSRVPRLPTGPYRLTQTKCQKKTVQHQCSLASSKIFWSFSCPLMTFVNQNHGKIRMFWDVQIHDLRILKVDLDLPTFWPYCHLKRPKFENKTSENIVILSWRRTFVIVQSRNFDKHCLHTSCLSRTARHWSGSTLCGRDSFFLDSGSEQRLIRKWP